MLSINPFAVAGASLPAGFLQGFLVVMALAVVIGTLFDIIHKGSAGYFFTNMRTSRARPASSAAASSSRLPCRPR